jgi:hypothetical protein
MKINGSRFSPIYQIIDSDTYRKNNNDVVLKTLLMPITISEYEVEYNDINNVSYNEKIINLKIFKNNINYLHYFVCEYGFQGTIDFIGGHDYIKVTTTPEEFEGMDASKFTCFNFDNHNPNHKICFRNSFFKVRKRLCIGFVDLLVSNKIDEISIYDKQQWTIKLGKYFTSNKNLDAIENKGKDILISFKRILDDGTRRNLKLKESSKKDIFCVIRWMTDNFDTLRYKDNMDLKNKRIRVYEYLLYDLTYKFSQTTYRLLNKSDLTMKDLKQLFSTINIMTIMKPIAQNELLRYNNAVNTIDIFNSNLKFSHRGKQALGEGNRHVQDSYRGHHPSYIGRICLTAASSGDPGRQFARVYNMYTALS